MIEKECQGSTETVPSTMTDSVVYGAIQQVCDLGVDAAPRHMVIQGVRPWRAFRKPRLSEPSAGPTGFHRLVILAALTIGPE